MTVRRTITDLRLALTAGTLALLIAFAGCTGSGDPGGAPPRRTGTQVERAPATAEDSSGPPENQVPRTSLSFLDRTSQAGIDFTYRTGEQQKRFAIIESLGGGVGLLDFDRDGATDAFIPGGGGYGAGDEVVGMPGRLYRNAGGWRFHDVSAPSGVTHAAFYSHGASVGDFDADGFPDVLVTGYGGLTLFRNQGDGTYSESATSSGLTDALWSSSAAWGDFDRDGHLDLYVAHYVNWSFANDPHCPGYSPHPRDICPPRDFLPLPHTLYMSNGDGTFRDGSEAAGLREGKDGETFGKGLGVVAADLDLDGDLDIYVGNDTVPNFLYRNDGTGRFDDVGLTSGTALDDRGLPNGSMGIDVGDLDLDGLPDLWVANYERESIAFYRNEGDCFFRHASQAFGVTAAGGLYVGWGTVLRDFDRDGDEDAFVSNGHVIRYPATGSSVDQVPLLFENQSSRRLVNVAPAAGDYLARRHFGRGVAAGDLDDDGRIDLVVSRAEQPVAVLANDSSNRNHWLAVRLIGTRSSRDPVGAVVTLHAGGTAQIRLAVGGGSYASTSDPRLFFGLGKVDRVDRIEIRWPSGATQSLEGTSADRTVTVREQPREPLAYAR